MSAGKKYEDTLVDSSRMVADMVSDAVGSDPERYAELMDLVFGGKGAVADRAARVAFLIADKHPGLVIPHVNRLIALALTTERRSLRKNVLRILTNYGFNGREKQLGNLADKCFHWIAGEYEYPAIQVYSIDIIRGLAEMEPDLKTELTAAIETALPFGSAGFRNKGKKTINELKQPG